MEQMSTKILAPPNYTRLQPPLRGLLAPRPIRHSHFLLAPLTVAEMPGVAVVQVGTCIKLAESSNVGDD